MKAKGVVAWIGAGPGDARLLTLRGAEALVEAAVVVYDSGVPTGVLQLAGAGAEMVRNGPERFPGSGDLAAFLVDQAREGRRVVRLLAGDAQASAGEVSAVAAGGVPVRFVPGVGVSAEAISGLPVAAREPARQRQPLSGQRVVVTRAYEQVAEFSRKLRDHGAEVLEVPCIRIEAPTAREPLVEALAGLGSYDWMVFTSANGVDMFFGFFFRAFEDLRDLGAVRLAAVGPGTAARLRGLHLKVDVTPKVHEGREIAKALKGFMSLEQPRQILLRAEVASPDLPRLLEAEGAIVDDVACYRTVAETADRTGDAARMMARGAEWVTFTSGSTVGQFHARFDLPEFKRRYPGVRTASLGPETTEALRQLSVTPAVEAEPHTMDGLIKAMERAAGASAAACVGGRGR